MLATALAWASLAAAAGAPDFTGTWQINPAKGQNLGMMAAVKQTVTITQTANELKIAEAVREGVSFHDPRAHADQDALHARRLGLLGKISTVSPRTRNVPRSNATSLRRY